MKFDIFVFGLAANVAMFILALVSICVKLYISRTEVLFGSKEITTDLRVEFWGLMCSTIILSWFIFSRLNP